MKMTKYRKKPIVIEAIQFQTMEDYKEILEWCEASKGYLSVFEKIHIIVRTFDRGESREIIVNVNDYVIKGIKGEFYSCEQDKFELTYEKI